MKHFARVELSIDQFEVLAQYCRADSKFPTWAAWNEMVGRETAAASGANPPSLVVDSVHFRGWCVRVGVTPCLDALRAYAMVRRSAVAPKYGAVGLDTRYEMLGI